MAFGNLVLGSSVSALVGIISLIVYVAVYTALNTEGLSTSVVSMLGVIPTVLAAVIVISIVVLGFGMITGR